MEEEFVRIRANPGREWIVIYYGRKCACGLLVGPSRKGLKNNVITPPTTSGADDWGGRVLEVVRSAARRSSRPSKHTSTIRSACGLTPWS